MPAQGFRSNPVHTHRGLRQGCDSGLRAPSRNPGSNPGSGINRTPANAAETAGSLVLSRTNPRRASNTMGRSSARYRTLPGPSGTGATIEQWQSQPSASARSALAASSRRSQRELRASPAVSPALSRRQRRRWEASSSGCSGSPSRARERRRSAGCCSSRPSGWVSTRATGSRSLGRSRVGARSEDDVQRALAPLQAEGWRLRHSLPWQGRGDIDSVAIAPTGIAVAIETKCAARRPVVSPAQPGGTRREVLGSNGLPGSER